MRKALPLFIFGLAVIAFFSPFFFSGKIPIPADTIVGMYHPWRDVVWDGLVSGVPYKNPLITDPVRQQYVWRWLSIEQLRQGALPLWNPYSFSGTPLLANFQSAALYPLNILFLAAPFPVAWGILVVLQPVMAGIFLYWYLRYFSLDRFAAALGALVFAFCGFSIAWLEWNTVIHTILWLPLILLAKEHLIRRFRWSWAVVLVIAESSAIFAGHLQVVFYSILFSTIYLFVRILQVSRPHIMRTLFPFLCTGLIVLAVTAIQWLPTIQFINLSARDIDQGSWMKEGWFIPWHHLVQFIAPDFFGNPTTNNYWGEWNYGEFIGYIGMLPLLFALYAVLFRRDKKTYAFGIAVAVCLLFALPTPVAKLLYLWNVPFLATSQPTRLLSLICFSLSILSALGLDYWIKRKTIRKTLISLSILSIGIMICWFFAFAPDLFPVQILPKNLFVLKKNLILPTLLFGSGLLLLVVQLFERRFTSFGIRRSGIVALCILLISAADLLRFGWKFTPFSPSEWLYPQTNIVQFLGKDQGHARVMATDRRIFPPNMAGVYGISDVSGYDPLYLLSYNTLVSAWTRNTPDITPGAFNRILTPDNPESIFADLLGVKYVISYGEHPSPKLKPLFSEGQSYLYENPDAFPKVFFVQDVVQVENKEQEMERMYALGNSLRTTAVTTESVSLSALPLVDRESARVVEYAPNRITVVATTVVDRLMVLADPWYPTWKVYVDGNEAHMHEVDFMLRGVVVPEGNHTVEFKNYLL